MNFIQALKLCGGSEERIRSILVSAKDTDVSERVKIYRAEWERIKYPAKYVWITSANIPMISVGNNQSMPLLMEYSDFIAEDWEEKK